MEPITLASITAAVTVLATEAGKGAASEAGKGLWQQIQARLGFSSAAKDPALAATIAKKLSEKPELAKEIVKLLQSASPDVGAARSLVGSIDAEKVVVVGTMSVDTFNMGD